MANSTRLYCTTFAHVYLSKHILDTISHVSECSRRRGWMINVTLVDSSCHCCTVHATDKKWSSGISDINLETSQWIILDASVFGLSYCRLNTILEVVTYCLPSSSPSCAQPLNEKNSVCAYSSYRGMAMSHSSHQGAKDCTVKRVTLHVLLMVSTSTLFSDSLDMDLGFSHVSQLRKAPSTTSQMWRVESWVKISAWTRRRLFTAVGHFKWFGWTP